MKGFLGGAGFWEGCFLVSCLINYDCSLLQDSEILQFEESGGPKRVAKRLLSKAREQAKIVSFSLHRRPKIHPIHFFFSLIPRT